MARYTKEFKFTIIKRMMPPNNESAESISRETGIPEGTLYAWKKQARSKGYAMPAGEQEPEKWSAQDKFLVVVETATLSELELSEYCRSYCRQSYASTPSGRGGRAEAKYSLTAKTTEAGRARGLSA